MRRENGQRPDVLLVLPPTYHTGRLADYNPKEPMGLMYLAAELRRQGMTAEILDADLMSLTVGETVGEILDRGAPVVGFSVLQRALPTLELAVSGMRRHGYAGHVCCGGVGATLSAERVLSRLSGVDSVVLGEGEVTLARLARQVLARDDWRGVPGLCVRRGGGVVCTGQPDKPDLDSLPLPSRDLLNECLLRTGYATVVGSRGCYASCSFCSNSVFERVSRGPAWRGRNPVAIADEIELLYREYGVRAVKFNDPNLFGPGRRGQEHVMLLCRELLRRRMDGLSLMAFTRASDLHPENCDMLRLAGFERMLIGIESANRKVIKALRKGETLGQMEVGISYLRGARMTVVPGFMAFNPYTTLDTLEQDLAFLDEYGFRPTLSKSLRVFDGTAIERTLEAEGRLVRRDPFDGYHEYTVDRDAATAYACLKAVSVNWISVLTSQYQGKFWALKRGTDFNSRSGFYSLQDGIYAVESRLLRAVIAWLRDRDFRQSDVLREVEAAREALGGIESDYVGRDWRSIPTGLVCGFDPGKMAERLAKLLHKRPCDTFPERYRWADD